MKVSLFRDPPVKVNVNIYMLYSTAGYFLLVRYFLWGLLFHIYSGFNHQTHVDGIQK